jgi:hypothetical protein
MRGNYPGNGWVVASFLLEPGNRQSLRLGQERTSREWGMAGVFKNDKHSTAPLTSTALTDCSSGRGGNKLDLEARFWEP